MADSKTGPRGEVPQGVGRRICDCFQLAGVFAASFSTTSTGMLTLTNCHQYSNLKGPSA